MSWVASLARVLLAIYVVFGPYMVMNMISTRRRAFESRALKAQRKRHHSSDAGRNSRSESQRRSSVHSQEGQIESKSNQNSYSVFSDSSMQERLREETEKLTVAFGGLQERWHEINITWPAMERLWEETDKLTVLFGDFQERLWEEAEKLTTFAFPTNIQSSKRVTSKRNSSKRESSKRVGSKRVSVQSSKTLSRRSRRSTASSSNRFKHTPSF